MAAGQHGRLARVFEHVVVVLDRLRHKTPKMDPKLLIPLNVGQQRSDALVPAQMTSRHLCAMPAARGLDEAATLAGGPLERRRRPDRTSSSCSASSATCLAAWRSSLARFGEVM